MVGSYLVGWGTMVGKLYLQHGAAIWKLLYGGLAADVASDLGEWERRAEEIVCKVMLSFVGKGEGLKLGNRYSTCTY